MRAGIAVFAAGLALMPAWVWSAQAAGSDPKLRAQIRRIATEACNNAKDFGEMLPGVRARLCACYADQAAKSLSASDLNIHLKKGRAAEAAVETWKEKGGSAMKRCSEKYF